MAACVCLTDGGEARRERRDGGKEVRQGDKGAMCNSVLRKVTSIC